VKSEYTFSPTRFARTSTIMVENARKRQSEIKDKLKQVEKVDEDEYIFQPRVLSTKTNEMAENNRKRASEYAIKMKDLCP
jgi:hypothetical protein